MEKTKPTGGDGRGLARDITRLKRDGSASAAEVREFVAQMKGRSPHEVLGMVAQSSLTQGIIVATIATVALVAVFTVVPYMMAGPPHVKAKKSHAAAADKPEVAKSDDGRAETKGADNGAEAKTDGDPQISKKALEKLGVDEVKKSDASANPLDRKDDDLLKELK